MTINETVWFWQDALYRLNLGKCHQSRLEYSARALKQVAHCHDMAPPQTLGELCIELARDRIRYIQQGINDGLIWWPSDKPLKATDIVGEYEYSGYRIAGDIQALRRAMYHKHTDPKKERLYQLIDKIRNA